MQTPRLIPLKHCSVDRAARMLHLEKEDLLHWMNVGLVTPAAQIHLSESMEFNFGPTDCVNNGLLQGAIDPCLSTKHSEFLFIGLKDEKARYLPTGVWSIRPDSGHIISTDSDGMINYERITQLGTPKALDGMSATLMHPGQINLSDLVIIYEDLQRIYHAINEGKELTEVLVNKQHDISSSRVGRVEPKQSEFIAKLIQCNPELKLFGKESSWPKKLKFINDHLEKKGIAKVNIASQTLNNWLSNHKF